MTSDEERMALLAGRPLEALEPDELEQVARWTELLADPETWEEPAPDLEDLVIASIGAAPAPTRSWATSSGRASGSRSRAAARTFTTSYCVPGGSSRGAALSWGNRSSRFSAVRSPSANAR